MAGVEDTSAMTAVPLRSRRSVLGSLAALVVVFVAGVLAWPPRARAGRLGAPVVLSDADRSLAALGRRIAQRRPVLARELGRFADRELGWARGSRSQPRTAARIRSVLLADGRCEADFRRGEAVTIDGWVLARSEVAAAICLHRIERRAPAS